MNRKFVGLAFLAIVTLMPRFSVFGQGGGACTNYGCMDIQWMSQVMNNGFQGCTQFLKPIARKLRNSKGFQGGDPSSSYGTKTINYMWTSCADCTPPPLNGIAVDGLPPFIWSPDGWQSFGVYECVF